MDPERQEDAATRLGEFANAFRVLKGPEPECFLDFLVYSSTEDCAEVVARIRVGLNFLPSIHHRLDEILLDQDDESKDNTPVN